MNGKCQTAGYGPAFMRRGFGHGHNPWFRRPKFNVPVNIDERESEYVVSVYATGFSKDQIKISVQDDVLYVQGTRELNENEKPNFTRQEFPVKNFERVISLESQVDVAGIQAKHENGVLNIRLPKSAQAKQPGRDVRVD